MKRVADSFAYLMGEIIYELIFQPIYHAVFPNFYFGLMILAGNCYKQVVLHLKRFLAL